MEMLEESAARQRAMSIASILTNTMEGIWRFLSDRQFSSANYMHREIIYVISFVNVKLDMWSF